MQREATGRDDEYGSGRDVREHGDGIDVGRNMKGQIGEGSGRSSHVGMEGVGFESYTIGAPPLRRLATNSHPIGVPIMGRPHLYGNVVPPRAQWSQPEAVPAGSIGRMGHGMQSSGVMRRDQVEVVEREGTQRTVQLPQPSTVPTLFDPSPREYTEEDEDRLSRKMVGAAVDKAFTKTPFDGTNFREWALRFRMNARVTNLWEFFMTLQYPVTMANGEIRDAMERLEALQAYYSQRATLAFWVLLHSVSATIQLQLDVFQESFSPAFEAWEYLMETYQAKDSVAKASLQRQLDNLKMGSQERVEEYINRATAIRDKLAMAGKMVDEDSFTLNLITGPPPHWEELRHSAMLHDISDSYALQRMMIQEQRYQDLISKTNCGDKRTTRPLELVHSDIMDLGDTHPSLRYMLTLKNDYTNYLWVAPLARRSDMAAVFSAWHREMMTKLPTKPLAALRTDNGGEYTANSFTDYLSSHGISHQTSLPHTPQQNGVAEWVNRTVMDRVRAMTTGANLSSKFWPYALEYAAWLHKRISCSSNPSAHSPYFMMMGRAADCDSKDGLSLFNLTSGASTAPAADADSTARSQWTTRDAAARLAVVTYRLLSAHFSQYKSAKNLYDAVVARYSSPATVALSRLMLPYLFPDLAAFATVTDLITHLRTSDTRYRAALPAGFCAKNPPPPCTSPSTT
ncbi:unnamed protein product [Closterium sp. NIES-54]